MVDHDSAGGHDRQGLGHHLAHVIVVADAEHEDLGAGRRFRHR